MKEELLEKIDKTFPEFQMVSVLIEKGGQLFNQKELKAIIEKDKERAITVVSRRYCLVQFRELFKTAISLLNDKIDGEAYYWWGRGQIEILPEGSEVGLLLSNSVNKAEAVRVRFCARIGRTMITLPLKMVSFRKVHRGGKVEIAILDYFRVLKELQGRWEGIVKHLSEKEATSEDIETIKARIGSRKRLSALIDEKIPHGEIPEEKVDMSLWEVFQKVIEAVTDRHFKSEMHRRQKLHRIAERVLEEIAIDVL